MTVDDTTLPQLSKDRGENRRYIVTDLPTNLRIVFEGEREKDWRGDENK